MTYQQVTGTLNPGGHPGSYNGQDAYSDLLVTEDYERNNLHRKRTSQSSTGDGCGKPELYARPTGHRNAPHVRRLTACYGGETAQTLDASYYKGTGERNGKEREILAEEPICMSDRKGRNGITEDGTATTLTAQEKERPSVTQQIVRRLSQLECCRLQGYPDGWTQIGEPETEEADWFRDELDEDGNVISTEYMGRWTETTYYYKDENGKRKKVPASAEYKAYGNSLALPFWQWLTRRIAACYEGKPPTLGSLFDGIGGYPLVWSRVNGPDSVIWASEIEPFPIAVTRQHFGDEDAGIAGDIRNYL